MKLRLDRLLTERGLATGRGEAARLIADGRVRVDGAEAVDPAQKIPETADVQLSDGYTWVSRAAHKLLGALDLWPDISVSDRTALDVGASTGGFTQVLLSRGACHVTALDVGRDQLHPSLRDDPRVSDLSDLNAKDLTAEHLPAPPELIVCDASFISLLKVVARPLSLAAPAADAVLLLKPQFELGPGHVNKKGVITDAADRQRALVHATDALNSLPGWTVRASAPSPLPGPHGNIEYLIHAQKKT